MKVWLAALVGVVVLRPVAAQAPSKGWPLDRAIDAVRAAGPNGKGSGEAARAWRTLAAVDVQRLPELLAGMDGAGQLAHNWLRAAIDRVLERAHQNQQPFPVTGLEAFLRDRGHDAQARRFAYELLLKQDKTVADRFLPRMLDDPSLELRRDAVARQFDRRWPFATPLDPLRVALPAGLAANNSMPGGLLHRFPGEGVLSPSFEEP